MRWTHQNATMLPRNLAPFADRLIDGLRGQVDVQAQGNDQHGTLNPSAHDLVARRLSGKVVVMA
jgi:hypothetical protein